MGWSTKKITTGQVKPPICFLDKEIWRLILLRCPYRTSPDPYFIIQVEIAILFHVSFGKQLEKREGIPELYDNMLTEWDRVLKPGGRAVILVAEQDALRSDIAPHAWRPVKQMKVRVLGQSAVLSVWQKD